MLDELKEDTLVRKVGGRFRLTALLQKRMVDLQRGALPLVDIKTDNLLEIAIQEILQDKIYLDSSEQVRITGEVAEAPDGPDIDPDSA